MSKKTRHTLKIGIRWAILGAVVWSLVAIIAFGIMDYVSANIVGQINGYNQAVHDQVPDTAYASYEK